MKKVLHLNAVSSGGAFAAAHRLSEALDKSGRIESKHFVYTGKPGNYFVWANSWWKKKFAFFLHAVEKLDFLRFEKNREVRFAFSHGLTGMQIADHPMVKDADILHLHWINKGFISLHGLEKLLNLGKPIVWTCHDMWPFTGGCYYANACSNYLVACGNCKMLKNPGEKDLSHNVYEAKRKLFLDAKNLHFVMPSKWLADIGRNSRTNNSGSIQVIPYAIDLDIFTPQNRAEAKVALGLDPKKRIILFAAVNIADKRKGFDDFIRVLEIMYKTNPNDYEIVYIGQNKDNQVDNGPFPFRFTGYIRDPKIMAAWYQASDIYVTTSNDDNLPNTVIESLSCGTPVAAFAVGGIPEMVEPDITGVLALVHDCETLARDVMKFLDCSKEEQEKYARNCREKALNNYTEKAVVEAYLNLYNSI